MYLLAANTAHSQGFTQKQALILRQVLAADGFINEKLHKEFWDETPLVNTDSWKPLQKRLISQTSIQQEYQKELWESTAISFNIGKVVKTGRLIVLDGELDKLMNENAPYPEGTAEYNDFNRSAADQMKVSKENARRMLQAAADKTPFTSVQGGTVVINQELIQTVIDQLNSSFDRLNILINPEWSEPIVADASNTDRDLDAILAIVRKEEVEEQNRQVQKAEQEKKTSDSLNEDIRKYNEITSSVYGRKMKETAWSNLVNRHPEAKGLALGDIIKLKYSAHSRTTLRSSSRELSVFQVQSMRNISIRQIKDWGFYGKSTIDHSYNLESIHGDDVVIDLATGIVWHQSGSESYMTWNEAERWLEELNESGYAGYSDWRLPTVEEGSSLLAAFKRNDLYTDSIFSDKQKWIWTGDKYGSDAAWYIDFFSSLVRYNYIDSPSCCVRPVRSIEPCKTGNRATTEVTEVRSQKENRSKQYKQDSETTVKNSKANSRRGGAATEYTSPTKHYKIQYDSNWEPVNSPDKSIDLMLACVANNCEETNIAISSFFNYQLKNETLKEFLRHADGKLITQNVRNKRFVKSFKIMKEGKAVLGNTDVYEVLMSYEYSDGRKRIRQTYMTFNKGNVYNMSFHSTPDTYESGLRLSKSVLGTFKFTN